MRNISFALTTPQILDRSKDVTRRLGWEFLKPGDYVRGVEKCQGLKPGEKIKPLGIIKILSVRRERLDRITKDEVRREGFPEMSCKGFIFMFCNHMKVFPHRIVTRIEFCYMEA